MMNYWGFDLGDGESTVARVPGEGPYSPEVVPVEGSPVLLTAWALMKIGELRIGERAARSASAALRSALSGGDKSNSVYIGCPAGWDKKARERYLSIFETLGLPAPQVISESRAVMVGAIQSNSVRDHVDLRTKSVLVIDIGSSTTDFAFVNEGREAEIRTGGEVALGGGIMDETLLEACVAASPQAAAIRKVFAASESWRVDCELRARRLKEQYFSRSGEEREDCSDALLIQYEEPLLFELTMDEAMARRLTVRPCAALGGRSFRDVFCAGLREVREAVGGVSRMSEVRDWCREVFPEAAIYADAEPEFSVAKGLAWCGRIDDELSRFRGEVDALIRSDTIETIVHARLRTLYALVMDKLLDPLLDKAVKPVLLDWREGRIERLSDMEDALRERIKLYLHSEEARQLLYAPVSDWMAQVSEELEKHSSAICRRYRVPDHSLKISSRLAASDLHVLEKVDALQMFAGDALTGAAIFVESVISVVIGLLCGGSGMALIAEGPAGIAIGIVSSLLLFAVGRLLGKEAMDEKLMSMKLPLLVRRAALSELLPAIEPPKLSLGGKADGNEAPKGLNLQLLPRLRWAGRNDIPERRMRTIRRKVREGYEELLSADEDEAVRALNSKMCREISDQIEQRLKALAEQVEIPL